MDSDKPQYQRIKRKRKKNGLRLYILISILVILILYLIVINLDTKDSTYHLLPSAYEKKVESKGIDAMVDYILEKR